MTADLAARPPAAVRGGLALVGETFGQDSPQPVHRVINVIGVVAARLGGGQNMPDMMRVIVPLRIVQRRPQQPRRVVVVFQH